jgi:Domain of unknown function (DUF5069)
MEPIVPLISSSVMGPLGARHLPRLWLKILLHSAGRLPEGYRHGRGGFDEMTLDDLGIDADAFIAYIEREQPTYLALEAWVREHATKLDAASIAEHNRKIAEREKPEQMAVEIRTALGLPPTITNSTALNDLDDWALAHRTIVAAIAP